MQLISRFYMVSIVHIKSAMKLAIAVSNHKESLKKYLIDFSSARNAFFLQRRGKYSSHEF